MRAANGGVGQDGFSYTLSATIDGGTTSQVVARPEYSLFLGCITLTPSAGPPNDVPSWNQYFLLSQLDDGGYTISAIGDPPQYEAVAGIYPIGPFDLDGQVLTDGCAGEGVSMTSFAPYSGSNMQSFSIVASGSGQYAITCNGNMSPLGVYDVGNVQWGGGTLQASPAYVVQTAASAPAGARLVSQTFTFDTPVARGTYPQSVGPVQNPMVPLPKVTSLTQVLPQRVPDDPSKDAVFGEAILPYFVVNETATISQQVRNSPFYLLRHSRYFKGTQPVSVPDKAPAQNFERQIQMGMTSTDSTSMTATTSLTIMADGGFSADPISLSVQATLENSLSVERSTSREVMTEVTATRTITVNEDEEVLIQFYSLVHKFDLFRGDGFPVNSWECTDSGDIFEIGMDVPPSPSS